MLALNHTAQLSRQHKTPETDQMSAMCIASALQQKSAPSFRPGMWVACQPHAWHGVRRSCPACSGVAEQYHADARPTTTKLNKLAL